MLLLSVKTESWHLYDMITEIRVRMGEGKQAFLKKNYTAVGKKQTNVFNRSNIISLHVRNVFLATI